jgi:hypothetical protein
VTVGAIVVTAAVVALVASLLLRGTHARVRGGVHARDTSFGDFQFQVSDCVSGEAFVPGFFGVDLRDGGGHSLRVVGTGLEAQLWLSSPPGSRKEPIPFGWSECSSFDVMVRWANVAVRRVHTATGRVHVTCGSGMGRLSADVDFARCAF